MNSSLQDYASIHHQDDPFFTVGDVSKTNQGEIICLGKTDIDDSNYICSLKNYTLVRNKLRDRNKNLKHITLPSLEKKVCEMKEKLQDYTERGENFKQFLNKNKQTSPSTPLTEEEQNIEQIVRNSLTQNEVSSIIQTVSEYEQDYTYLSANQEIIKKDIDDSLPIQIKNTVVLPSKSTDVYTHPKSQDLDSKNEESNEVSKSCATKYYKKEKGDIMCKKNNTKIMTSGHFTCDKCNKPYKTSKGLMQHKIHKCIIEHRYPCPYCPCRFTQPHDIQHHVYEAHRQAYLKWFSANFETKNP